MMCGYVASLIGSEYTDLLDLCKIRITYIDGRDSGYDRPVLTPLGMRLEREALTRLDDELLHLIEWEIFEDIVDSPWAVPDFKIATFSETLREICDLRIEVFLIGFILHILHHITRVMGLGTQSVDDTDSLRAEKYCFRDLRSKSISSLREDDLTIFSTFFGFCYKCLQTRAYTRILIDR